jgi:hypothetical protein
MSFFALLLAASPALHPSLPANAAYALQSEVVASPQRTVANTDDGLSLAEVIQSLPVDPASIVTILLLLAFIGGVFWFGTRSGPAAASSKETSNPR